MIFTNSNVYFPLWGFAQSYIRGVGFARVLIYNTVDLIVWFYFRIKKHKTYIGRIYLKHKYVCTVQRKDNDPKIIVTLK